MAYDSADPRARLSTGAGPSNGSTTFGSASYVKFYESTPQLADSSALTWLARGQYFVVAYSEVQPGGTLERPEQVDEYMVLLPDSNTGAEVVADDDKTSAPGNSVLILPPGTSRVALPTGGRIVRIFSHLADDLALLCANAGSYTSPAPNLPPFEAWPEPVDGYRIRQYSLDVEQQPERFGRIWRSRNLMVNYSYPRPGPRDVTKMSPHTHDDFEQGSLVLGGSFVHHIRWPWTTDMRSWRNDEHEICAGPSLAVIPPLTVHTSQQVGREVNQLVDIFAPPRTDFSNMEGWVLNADEYPLPRGAPA